MHPSSGGGRGPYDGLWLIPFTISIISIVISTISIISKLAGG